MDANTTEPK